MGKAGQGGEEIEQVISGPLHTLVETVRDWIRLLQKTNITYTLFSSSLLLLLHLSVQACVHAGSANTYGAHIGHWSPNTRDLMTLP